MELEIGGGSTLSLTGDLLTLRLDSTRPCGRAASVIGLVGPSGCGKSTLLELICGLLEGSAGTISVGGQAAAEERLNRCAFMPQRDLLLPWYSASTTPRWRCATRGWGGGGAAPPPARLFERFGLAGFEAARPPSSRAGCDSGSPSSAP